MTPRVEATITGALFATLQGVILHFLSVESAVVGTALAYVNTSGAVVSELLQDADPRTVFDAQRDANVTRDRLAALLREAAADQARLDWLERAVPEGLFRRLTDDLRGEWHGSFREWIDMARSVPSPTPTKEP